MNKGDLVRFEGSKDKDVGIIVRVSETENVYGRPIKGIDVRWFSDGVTLRYFEKDLRLVCERERDK